MPRSGDLASVGSLKPLQRLTTAALNVSNLPLPRASLPAINRAKPLPHDTLATELTSLAEHNRTVLNRSVRVQDVT
jgi:hypothetical protein